MQPQIEEICKVRAKMVTDFDSYRRYVYIYVCMCMNYVYMCMYICVK
jgi:hypothetical protein